MHLKHNQTLQQRRIPATVKHPQNETDNVNKPTLKILKTQPRYNKSDQQYKIDRTIIEINVS